MGLSIWHWLILVVFCFAVLWPLGVIFQRTGRHWAWALLGLLPAGPIALLWWIAYGRWAPGGRDA